MRSREGKSFHALHADDRPRGASPSGSILLYVRAVKKGGDAAAQRGAAPADPKDKDKSRPQARPEVPLGRVRLHRSCSGARRRRPRGTAGTASRRYIGVPPGEYDVYFALRERPATPDKKDKNAPPAKTTVLKQSGHRARLQRRPRDQHRHRGREGRGPAGADARGAAEGEPVHLRQHEADAGAGEQVHEEGRDLLDLRRLQRAARRDREEAGRHRSSTASIRRRKDGEKYFNKTSPQNFNAQTLPPQWDGSTTTRFPPGSRCRSRASPRATTGSRSRSPTSSRTRRSPRTFRSRWWRDPDAKAAASGLPRRTMHRAPAGSAGAWFPERRPAGSGEGQSMNRFFTIVASTVVAGLVGSNLPARAQSDSLRATGEDEVAPRRQGRDSVTSRAWCSTSAARRSPASRSRPSAPPAPAPSPTSAALHAARAPRRLVPRARAARRVTSRRAVSSYRWQATGPTRFSVTHAAERGGHANPRHPGGRDRPGTAAEPLSAERRRRAGRHRTVQRSQRNGVAAAPPQAEHSQGGRARGRSTEHDSGRTACSPAPCRSSPRHGRPRRTCSASSRSAERSTSSRPAPSTARRPVRLGRGAAATGGLRLGRRPGVAPRRLVGAR